MLAVKKVVMVSIASKIAVFVILSTYQRTFPPPMNEFPFEYSNSDVDEVVAIELPSRVILFDDDWHSFDEVIEQLMLATRCSFAHAEDVVFTVHHNGRGTAFTGSMTDCLRVSTVLEEIALHTLIEV